MGGELGVAALERLDERVVDEYELLLGLDEIVALLAYVLEKGVHVYGRLGDALADHGVYDDVGAGATDARATVHDDRAAVRLRVGARRLLDEVEHGQDEKRHAVVRPVGEVILVDEALQVGIFLPNVMLCLAKIVASFGIELNEGYFSLIFGHQLDGKEALCVEGQGDSVNMSDLNEPIGLARLVGPILIALDLVG